MFPLPSARRWAATRTASAPACSSPISERDAPVTPCTMEMLPASRLESCARNSVGRSPPASISFSRTCRFRGRQGGQRLQHALIQRDVALPAAGGDDQVHLGDQAARPCIVDGQPRGIGAEALPRLHLPLVALTRDLRVEVSAGRDARRRARRWRDRHGARGTGEGGAVRLPPLPRAGDQADAGDPDLVGRHLPQPCPGSPMRRAVASMASRSGSAGKGMMR
jgi:hypothetical protein